MSHEGAQRSPMRQEGSGIRSAIRRLDERKIVIHGDRKPTVAELMVAELGEDEVGKTQYAVAMSFPEFTSDMFIIEDHGSDYRQACKRYGEISKLIEAGKYVLHIYPLKGAKLELKP